MKLDFLSPAYFICLLLAAAFIVAMYFLLRKAPMKIKKMTLLLLMLVNIFQHLGKGMVWPHLFGTGFGHINTAYNVCAFLILLSPFALFSKNSALKDFMTYVGTIGPSLAIIVPYWFQGQNVFTWEAARFYFCHNLLIATSILPALLGMSKPNYKNFWKISLLFFLMLILIVFNDIVCVSLGWLGNGTETLFEALYSANPCMVMHPALPNGFGFVLDLIRAFTPAAFWGSAEKPFVPLLWYAIPVFLAIALLAFLFGILFDGKRFREDVKKLRRSA